MATLKDVAKLANVDVSTVSRALNNTSYVHPDTKKKVYKAAEQLGYRPNLIAKSLRQGRKNVIGVVVPTINFSVFGGIVQGIEAEASKRGYSVMITNTKDNPEAEEKCLERMRNGLVDGIVIASTGQNKRLIRDIKSSGISVIQVIRKQDQAIDSVVADYYASGYEAVRYLAKKGCTRIGFINGSMEIIPYKERYDGYHRAMKQLGLPEYVTGSAMPKADYLWDGYREAIDLIDNVCHLDAIITAVDMQGLGALRALKEKGRRVPHDVKVISLTGHAIGEVLETSLTSMEIPTREMGEQAVRIIIEDIEAGKDAKKNSKHMVFTANLAERESG